VDVLDERISADVHDIPFHFRAGVARHPRRALIRGPLGPLSFAELDGQSDALAGALTAAGLEAGDRVALYAPNGIEFIRGYLGILKAGGVVVPLNTLLNPRELAYILSDSGARLFLFHPALGASAQAAAAALEAPPRRLDLSALGGGREVPAVAVDPWRQPAAILYTSGTTGRPKGAVLTHANLVTNTRSVMAALELEPGRDNLLVVLPLFHAFAATVGLLTPLLHGLALTPVPRFEPRLVGEYIEAGGATVFLGVPSMYGLFLRLPPEGRAQWRPVRLCVSGGAALPEAVRQGFEEAFAVPILEGDGPTECGPVTCVNPPRGPRKGGSVGPPVPGVEMAIHDDAGRPLPVGEVGEVWVRGPSVMAGYWGLPEATAEAFAGDWFRTGDLGYRDDDGWFYLVDRKKDLVIVNGMNVYPRVIEEVLHRHPEIAEAAVVGEPHPRQGEVLVAHVVLRSPGGLDVKAVRAWCREHLGAHEVPRRVEFRGALPRNAAGKVLKRELRRVGEIERGVR